LLTAAGVDRNKVSVALDETMRADFALLLLDALPGAKRSFLHDTVGYLRARKDDAEFELLKASALLNDRAAQAGFAALREGMTEREVADVIRKHYKDNGAQPEFTIVCFGANGAFPHHHTGETKLQAGDAVLIDTGCRLNGYPSDMTRVGYFGGKPEGYDDVQQVLERAVQAAVAAAKPGVKAKDVDKAARDVITAAGYGEFFLHRTGHGLGIDVHEGPYITATSETVLEPGMVFSIEPGIYLSGRFGLRLEEIVIVRGNRAEVLSELSRDAVGV
jgi:Xaa-Pro aminopeptidase